MSKPTRSAKPVVTIIGAGGMGLASARRLARGRHIVLADFSEIVLDNAVEELSVDGHDVEGLTIDVSDRDSVREVATTAGSRGAVDTIVHTAGVSGSLGAAEQIHKVNMQGTAYVLEEFLAVAGQDTALVAIASVAGHSVRLSTNVDEHFATASAEDLPRVSNPDIHALESNLAYAVSKYANLIRVRASVPDWAARGARINTISPGYVASAMTRAEEEGADAEKVSEFLRTTPAGRSGTVDDIADAVEFLASERASYIIGADIRVDGGATASTSPTWLG